VRAERFLLGLCQRPLDNETAFDGIAARLNELVLRQRRDASKAGGAEERPIALAIGRDEHVARSADNPAKHG
jgi:hypothetical protein